MLTFLAFCAFLAACWWWQTGPARTLLAERDRRLQSDQLEDVLRSRSTGRRRSGDEDGGPWRMVG